MYAFSYYDKPGCDTYKLAKTETKWLDNQRRLKNVAKKRKQVDEDYKPPKIEREFELTVVNPSGITSPSLESLFWKLKLGDGVLHLNLRKFQVCNFFGLE